MYRSPADYWEEDVRIEAPSYDFSPYERRTMEHNDISAICREVLRATFKLPNTIIPSSPVTLKHDHYIYLRLNRLKHLIPRHPKRRRHV